jgi:hypothetical protein
MIPVGMILTANYWISLRRGPPGPYPQPPGVGTGTTSRAEAPRRAEYLRTHIVQISFSEQTSRRSIVKLGDLALEPRLDHLGSQPHC